jgi:predicted enzyme related to lactoylglutathione lyase
MPLKRPAMPDPFEVLRTPVVPSEPDPVFAARLRERVERALSLPKGATVSDLTREPATVATGADRAREGDLAYVSLFVPDLGRATAFFSTVLGWSYGPGSSEQGRQIEGSTPQHGMWGNQERSNLLLCYGVDDIRAALERVRDAGGRAEEPTEEPYGVIAMCEDDQAVTFSLYEWRGDTERGPSGGRREGDVVYVTLEVPDSSRARAFYGAVLGWHFTPGYLEDGWNVDGVVPGIGMVGGRHPATALPMYRVDDIRTAVARVRSAGGTATEPDTRPYGISSDCTDDVGTRFYLGQL